CSRKRAMPDLPTGSSAAPLRYQTMWVTTGARRSGMTTTSRPFASVKCATCAAAAEGEVIAIRSGSKEARRDAAAGRRNRDDPATYRTPRAAPLGGGERLT